MDDECYRILRVYIDQPPILDEINLGVHILDNQIGGLTFSLSLFGSVTITGRFGPIESRKIKIRERIKY